MPLPDHQECDHISIRLDTAPALDRRTDGAALPWQYRALRALHCRWNISSKLNKVT